MHYVWLWFSFFIVLTLAYDFYKIQYEASEFSFGRARTCKTIEECDEDFLCNHWNPDSKLCFLGTTTMLLSASYKYAYLKVRSSNQCGLGRNRDFKRDEVLAEFYDGFECHSLIDSVLVKAPQNKAAYETQSFRYSDESLNAYTLYMDVTKDTSKAPFNEENYWKFYKLTLRVDTAETYGYSVDNVPVVVNESTSGMRLDVYCRKGNLYLDAENMKQRLTEFLVNGKPTLVL